MLSTPSRRLKKMKEKSQAAKKVSRRLKLDSIRVRVRMKIAARLAKSPASPTARSLTSSIHHLKVSKVETSSGESWRQTSVEFFILDLSNCEILKFWNFEILKFWSCEILEFWNFEIFKFWNFQILKFWNFEILKFWNFEILKFWNFEILKFWNFESCYLFLYFVWLQKNLFLNWQKYSAKSAEPILYFYECTLKLWLIKLVRSALENWKPVLSLHDNHKLNWVKLYCIISVTRHTH